MHSSSDVSLLAWHSIKFQNNDNVIVLVGVSRMFESDVRVGRQHTNSGIENKITGASSRTSVTMLGMKHLDALCVEICITAIISRFRSFTQPKRRISRAMQF